MRKSSFRPLLAAALVSVAFAGLAHAQTLVVDTAFQLKTADPARSFEPTAATYLHAVYQTLLTFEGGDATDIVPGLATLVSVSDDAKTFTLQMIEGATFSDGTPVTAEDALFSLNRAKNLKGSAAFMLADMTFAAGDSEGQIVITSANPDPGLPARLTYPAFSIINADAALAEGASDAENAAEVDGAEASLAQVSLGSGPYMLSSFDMTSEVVLVRNDNYWGTPAAFEQIVLRNTANAAQQMNIMRGVSQIAFDLRPDQIGSLGETAVVIQQPGADMGWVFLNANPDVSATASNPDIVEAVRYGIDYAGVLNIAGEGAGRPGGIIPDILLGTLDTDLAPARDLERAAAAVARSGIENPTLDFVYASDIAKHGISFGDIGAKIQADLAEIGITVNLVPQPVAQNLDAYRAGQLEMSVQWWGAAFPDPSYYLAFSPSKLVGTRVGWAENAEVSALDQEALSVIESADRDLIYKEYQSLLNEVGPYIPLFQPPTTLVSTTAVSGVAYHPTWTVDLTAVQPAD